MWLRKADLHTDGSVRSVAERSGIGGWLCGHNAPSQVWYWYSKEIPYELAINSIEYQAIIHGVSVAVAMEVDCLYIYTDSDLVVKQISGKYNTRNERLLELMAELKELLTHIPQWRMHHVPRELNSTADTLAGFATGRKDAIAKIEKIGGPYGSSIKMPKLEYAKRRKPSRSKHTRSGTKRH